jgi:tRNA(Ile)-lysidine synthase
VAAHVNHGLRPEAAQEQQFVERQCQRWGIACHTKSIDVRGLARQAKTSLEDAGRQARYGFFNELLRDLQADVVATAHHQDDQAETVSFTSAQGNRMPGLRGILPRNGQLVRPLLPHSKHDLLAYLQDHQIIYCVDESNQDESFLRNRIRHQLIPMLQAEYNPQITENLSRLAGIIRTENDFLQQIVQGYWQKLLCAQDKAGLEMDAEGIKTLPLAVQRRLTMMALSSVGGLQGWEAQDVEKVLDLLHKPGSAKILQLKKGIIINKSYDRIVFTSQWQETGSLCIEVGIPGQVVLPNGNRYHFALQKSAGFKAAPGDICLDYDKLSLPLVLRSRRPGDMIVLTGSAGHKKLKKYLNEQRIPVRERNQIAILASRSGEIYALPGLYICPAAAVNSKAKTYC